ncbi:hypothetical protein V6N13_117961 [Hibiscus sabdariffa]|uniref:Uncharacterized protein n=1 Tax=Hibiscus sabdariffa TaxID=183260 RepID=A0ABR2Q976_9ROSI
MESLWSVLLTPYNPQVIDTRPGFTLKICTATICSGRDFGTESVLTFTSEADLIEERRNICVLSPRTPNAKLGIKMRGFITLLCSGPRAISLIGYWIADEIVEPSKKKTSKGGGGGKKRVREPKAVLALKANRKEGESGDGSEGKAKGGDGSEGKGKGGAGSSRGKRGVTGEGEIKKRSTTKRFKAGSGSSGSGKREGTGGGEEAPSPKK